MTYRKLSDLLPDEIRAARDYGSDSTHHHNLAQRSRAANMFPGFGEFMGKARTAAPALSMATTRFELTDPLTVYSGFGWGIAAVGSLHADPLSALVGLTYRYPGHISTSTSRETAESFAEKGWQLKGDRPVLLVINLPAGFTVLPMKELGADSSHENEMLLDRNLAFRIDAASATKIADIEEDVLELTLAP
ncbi:ADP-ribosyltransferase [Azospirillum sp. TSO5]|uniref:ADP-ribosyltransferase n=1 Tax=Azospirillum sp. TSO5 TaxID=716760 RepID=UPI000D658739|nr:ADP-ribosyltransferase [Azospirillum sp. TSO5]